MTMTPRRLVLTEHTATRGVCLDAPDIVALRRANPWLSIEPSPTAPSEFDLTPDQHIGVIQLPTITIEIRPKTPMSSVLFLVSYAADSTHWSKDSTHWDDDATLVDLIGIALCRSIERATRRGLQHGYRPHRELLRMPRGRLLFQEQLQRHFNIAPPIAVEHDLYTPDIEENRILLAALTALRSLPLRSQRVRQETSRAGRLFGSVEAHHYDARSVPEPSFTQLNRHYEPAIRFAQLVLRSTSFDLGHGGHRSDAFLIDMNVVFERFLRIAFREALGVDLRDFPDRSPRLRLDTDDAIPLRPDLCLLRDGEFLWVGDAKYKRLAPSGYQNADMYQMLAYLVSTGLGEGTLIYAAQDGVQSANHVVRHLDRVIRVRTLDLTATPSAILGQVRAIAERVQAARRSQFSRGERTQEPLRRPVRT
jgi:5-methylcytosine-specific restriction enzyme subunit McrC